MQPTDQRSAESERMQEDQEVIREFLVESHENLSRLDQELVELEKHPKDAELLASIFRTFHTIKGTCGFLAFSILEKITHQAESLLSQLRDGQRELDPSLVSLILETVDATRRVLASIEANGNEGPDHFEELTERLRLTASGGVQVKPPSTVPAQIQSQIPPQIEARDQARDQILDQAHDQAQSKARPEPHPQPKRSDLTVVEAAGPPEIPDGARSADDQGKSSAVADANIRVGVGLLDKLMDLVGELVLTRNQILQFNTEREDATLNATSQRLNLITTELQEGVMKTRMQPIGMVWNKLPRVVRDVALSLGKQIRLEMDGAETELDRTIIEAIKDPLVHLVRNSCDHGVEPPEVRLRAGKPAQGKLTLRAYHEGGQVNIEIGDDGAGVDVARVKEKAIEKGLLRPEHAQKLSDREALNLIFQPGFSTAQTITNVSGRGVGMDVVKSNIEKIGGAVDIFSRPGEGTTVKLKIPLTLAIIPGLVVTSGGERFVIPQVSLLELIRLEGDSSDKHIEYVHGTPVYRRRGSLLPIAYLNQVLGMKPAEQGEAVSMVVLQAEDRQFGLVVDGINDTQEIVVKPLGKQLKGLSVYAGATIMGDGRVALILDVLGIGQCSGVLAESHEQGRGAAEQRAQAGVEQQRLLLFRAGTFERLAVPLSLVARLEEFPLSSIERASGSQVVQYRNQILPLVPLREILEPGAPQETGGADPAQVIVFNDGGRSLGVVVDQILDVVEGTIAVRKGTARKGLLGSAVVGKRITDFIDLNHVLSAAAEDWFHRGASPGAARNILVADSSSFSRGLIRNSLDMAGYAVIEAASAEEAIRGLENHPIDLVMTALDLPCDGAHALQNALRRRPEWEGIPILALLEKDSGVQMPPAQAEAFHDCREKYDRQAILEAVARLTSERASTAESPACVAGGR
jgi:two-component system, chemotaxis family, sensor kinase CheA